MSYLQELNHLANVFDDSFAGPSWHGPALLENLKGITGEQAATQTPIAAHSIWSIVLHLNAWVRVVQHCLDHETYAGVTGAEDWPVPANSSQDEWQGALRTLQTSYAEMTRSIENLEEQRLGEVVGSDPPMPLYAVLHGLINHTAYHSGQIALIRKHLNL